jgi:hypothetical protein
MLILLHLDTIAIVLVTSLAILPSWPPALKGVMTNAVRGQRSWVRTFRFLPTFPH